MEDKSKLFAKVAQVMASVRTLAKDGTNTYDKYQYVTADSAFERLGAAMAAVNLVALPSVIELRTDEVAAASGKMQTRSIIHGQITLADGETGATWTNDWWGEGVDRGDKSINKAVTAMMKYHLLRLFMVGTGEDADADSPDIEQPQRRTTQKPTQHTNHRQPNHTNGHRNTTQRPSTPVTEDVNYYDSEQEWNSMAAEADANKAADVAAAAPLVWPTDMGELELCGGLRNSPDLPRQPYRLIEDITTQDENSRSMSEKQYGFMTSLIDKRYGGGHNAILSALCGRPVTHTNPTGFGVKKLIDWLNEPDAHAEQLAVLDELVSFLKQDIAQFEVA